MFKYTNQVNKNKDVHFLILMVTQTKADISLYPALNTGNSTCQGSSSSRTIITGNWKDIYVYGYYQKVLESKVSASGLSTTNTSIIYQPLVYLQNSFEMFSYIL